MVSNRPIINLEPITAAHGIVINLDIEWMKQYWYFIFISISAIDRDK